MEIEIKKPTRDEWVQFRKQMSDSERGKIKTDIVDLMSNFTLLHVVNQDEFLDYCKQYPAFEDVVFSKITELMSYPDIDSVQFKPLSREDYRKFKKEIAQTSDITLRFSLAFEHAILDNKNNLLEQYPNLDQQLWTQFEPTITGTARVEKKT
jgi:hypothetical protein